MNKLLENETVASPVTLLTTAEQLHIKGGMIAICDEKKKRVIVRS